MQKQSEGVGVVTSVGDVSIYVGEAFQDERTRRWFAGLIESLRERLERGAIGLARKRAEEARAALHDAARLDPNGAREAEREALLLALNAATHRISARVPRPPRGIELKITLG